MEKATKQAEKIAKQAAKKSQTGSTSESRKRPATTDDAGNDHSMRQKVPKKYKKYQNYHHLNTSIPISVVPASEFLKTMSV